jgi:hypothetical protein
MINSYSFGSIEVNGRTYKNDLIIFPERVMSNWWRKEGHMLNLEDLEEVIEERPEVLIIGTGHNGAMQVPEEVVGDLKRQGIEVIVENTRKAYKTYNDMSAKRKCAAALHLTC